MSEFERQWDVGEMSFTPPIASITWEVKDIFGFSPKVDLRLYSPTFNFLDAIWCLRLCPNGTSDDQSEGWISLYLMKKKSISQEVRIRFGIGIMGRNDLKIRYQETEHTFDENMQYMGWCKFYKTSDLRQKSDEIAPDGTLTVVCTIRANTCEGVHAAVQTDTLLGTERLGYDFSNLLVSEEATDVILKVMNREFKVHRAVLIARSSVFRAMMKYDMKEKNTGLIEIDDCDPDAFQLFLTYLYSGNLENFSLETVFDLHTVADKYDAQELKTRCAQFIKDNLTVETFCDVLLLSLKHNKTTLLERAILFFAENLTKVLVTTKWLSFVKENPEEANELHLKAAKYYRKPE